MLILTPLRPRTRVTGLLHLLLPAELLTYNASSTSASAKSIAGVGRRRFFVDIEVLNVTQTRGPESQTREESCQALGLYEADYKTRNHAGDSHAERLRLDAFRSA